MPVNVGRASKIAAWSFPVRSLCSIESNPAIPLLNTQHRAPRVVTDSTSVRGRHSSLLKVGQASLKVEVWSDRGDRLRATSDNAIK